MTPTDVQRVLAAAARVGPGAALALRIAAVTGAGRGEIAALRWDDLEGDRLTIDSTIIVQRDRDHDGATVLVDASIKPVSDRTVCIDRTTARMIEELRSERSAVSAYMFSTRAAPPNPDQVGEWWQRARELAGVRGAGSLDDLHRSFAATVAHVLEFEGSEPALEPDFGARLDGAAVEPDVARADDRAEDRDRAASTSRRGFWHNLLGLDELVQ